MLRGQTVPRLVAFYDIWWGNGARLFFQPLSTHGALLPMTSCYWFRQFRSKIANFSSPMYLTAPMREFPLFSAWHCWLVDRKIRPLKSGCCVCS